MGRGGRVSNIVNFMSVLVRFVLSNLFFTVGALGSSTTGRFLFVSMASKCVWMIGILGKF